MREKIEELLQHHKTAKQECWEYLSELHQLGMNKMSDQEKSDINFMITRGEEENAWRGVFISQLEDLL